MISNKNIFQKVFTIMSYVMFPPLFLLKVVRQYYMLTGSSNQFECKFEELQLEKEHLLAYLRRVETGNHNHLVQVHLHGTPGLGQPLPPRRLSGNDQSVPNLETQLPENNISKPQTKTKRKRNVNSTYEKVDLGSETKRHNGFNGFDANLAAKTDNFPAACVSELDHKFEKLAPVGKFETIF